MNLRNTPDNSMDALAWEMVMDWTLAGKAQRRGWILQS